MRTDPDARTAMMLRRTATMLQLLLVALLACGSKPQPIEDPGTAPISPSRADLVLGKRLDAVIDRAIADQDIVGVVAMVARDGEVVYARAAGFADREAKRLIREDTQFRWASMTKPVVSVAALVLVDQGKLSLDDPVTKWLPEWKPKLADGRVPAITVKHLITHTAGLDYKFMQAADGPYHKADVSDGLAEPGLGLDENLRRIASAPLIHEPGTAWHYSLAVDVLGAVVAKAGGAELPQVVKRLVLEPLGMTDTTFAVTDRNRIAWPYAHGKPPKRMTEPHDMTMGGMTVRLSPARVFDSASFPSGGAGLAGTARDYLKFAEALRTGKLLSPETRRALTENQVAGISGMGEGQGFGLGVGIVLDPGKVKMKRGAGSFGWGGIYGTAFWVDPGAKLSVVIRTNVAGDTTLDADLEQAIYNR